MWIFDRNGFFALACARQGDGSKSQPPDPDRIAIRARLRMHLENLQEKFPELKEFEIWSSPDSDYLCRIFVPKELAVRIVGELILEMDYSDFKPSVHAVQDSLGKAGRACSGSLLDVWRRLYRVQERVHGPGLYSWESVHEETSASAQTAR